MALPLSLQIRAASQEDLATITAANIAMALETEHKRLDPDLARRGVQEALNRPEYARFMLAESGGRVVGQCMITYEWSDWRSALFWWIQSVYVDPEFRGRGVFKAIFEHVSELARGSGESCGLRLYVEAENKPAISTYQKLGMRPSGHIVYEIDWSTPE